MVIEGKQSGVPLRMPVLCLEMSTASMTPEMLPSMIILRHSFHQKSLYFGGDPISLLGRVFPLICVLLWTK